MGRANLWRAGLGLALGAGIGSLGACGEDYHCGERNLPGTADCPCLGGETCAADLVCVGGVCQPTPSEGATSGDVTSDSGTASDTSTDPGSDPGTDPGPGGSDTGTTG